MFEHTSSAASTSASPTAGGAPTSAHAAATKARSAARSARRARDTARRTAPLPGALAPDTPSAVTVGVPHRGSPHLPLEERLDLAEQPRELHRLGVEVVAPRRQR